MGRGAGEGVRRGRNERDAGGAGENARAAALVT
jgi:hypothetical protein